MPAPSKTIEEWQGNDKRRCNEHQKASDSKERKGAEAEQTLRGKSTDWLRDNAT